MAQTITAYKANPNRKSHQHLSTLQHFHKPRASSRLFQHHLSPGTRRNPYLTNCIGRIGMELNKSNYECDLNNLKATELRLGLPGTESAPRGSKRSADDEGRFNGKSSSKIDLARSSQEAQPVAKAQVVGWPPVRSYRRNNLQARKVEAEAAAQYVKVAMDGAPYLRKMDLKTYKGYKELKEALEDMFKCFSLGDLSGMESCNGSEYAVTYEDKDGDWMLIGDVPWNMFVSSCKRLRIMRGNEARGLSSST